MLDHEKILQAFREALGGIEGPEGMRPRTIAVKAHAIYCSGLDADAKKPALETFRKFASGRFALPEVVALLVGAGIHPVVRTAVDRTRLRVVFEEVIQRLEARLLRGQAKPLQIARRAYEIYTRDESGEAAKPSHHTFEKLIYGKGADPEILTLIESALKKRD